MKRVVVVAALAAILLAGPAWARWAKVDSKGIVREIYRGRKGVTVGGINHSRGIFKKWSAEELAKLGIKKIVRDKRPPYNPRTQNVRLNRIKVKDRFGRETWTIINLPLPERKDRVRSNRRRKYRSAFGGSLAIIDAMLETFQGFRAGGIELPPKMIEILNSWIEINKANPLPKR